MRSARVHFLFCPSHPDPRRVAFKRGRIQPCWNAFNTATSTTAGNKMCATRFALSPSRIQVHHSQMRRTNSKRGFLADIFDHGDVTGVRLPFFQARARCFSKEGAIDVTGFRGRQAPSTQLLRCRGSKGSLVRHWNKRDMECLKLGMYQSSNKTLKDANEVVKRARSIRSPG